MSQAASRRAAKTEKRLREYGLDISEAALWGCLDEVHRRTYPQWNEEELTYHPHDAMEFVNGCRRALHHYGLDPEFILNQLSNMRKEYSRTKYPSIPPVNTAKALIACGCQATPEEFREAIRDVYVNEYRLRPTGKIVSHERLTWRPNLALCFVNTVQRKLNCMRIPDHLILRTLVALRKRNSKKKQLQ